MFLPFHPIFARSLWRPLPLGSGSLALLGRRRRNSRGARNPDLSGYPDWGRFHSRPSPASSLVLLFSRLLLRWFFLGIGSRRPVWVSLALLSPKDGCRRLLGKFGVTYGRCFPTPCRSLGFFLFVLVAFSFSYPFREVVPPAGYLLLSPPFSARSSPFVVLGFTSTSRDGGFALSFQVRDVLLFCGRRVP